LTPRTKIEIITLFPDYFDSVLKGSIIGRGLEKRLFEIEIVNLREFTLDKHRTADDTPYGGGGGMALKIEPLYGCLKALGYGKTCREGEQIVLTSAAGKQFAQKQATAWSLLERLTIICGHYLGVDERILEMFEIDEISIGDYVLTGGEPAATVIVEAVSRLIPGVLGNFESGISDSHQDIILGTPVYTKPEEFMGHKTPRELVGGNHAEIEKFRRQASLKKTFKNRPELLEKAELSKEDLIYIDGLKKATDKKIN